MILSELLKFEIFFKNTVERAPILRSMRTFLTKMKMIITSFEVNTTTIRLWCCIFMDFSFLITSITALCRIHTTLHTMSNVRIVMYVADFVIEPDGLNKVSQKVEHNCYRFILNN